MDHDYDYNGGDCQDGQDGQDANAYYEDDGQDEDGGHGGYDRGDGQAEKEITQHAHDAERAIMDMIQDEQMEGLHDPEVWHVVEGFMDRVVKLLSYLEEVHEQSRPHDHHGSKLDGLQHEMAQHDGDQGGHDPWSGHEEQQGNDQQPDDNQYYDDNGQY
ncbi:hypothetical protein PV05_07167 [Exophiala xenobiotica]|uniref:Uncharacterized protein n=1 Tax=Exophiala xenobiotica TaxID=348802 RepID=A0A0D2EHD1_9EURO|nr:uncharacterized protein PV05_07167 [Exophiala xenobiotica]KIW54833.1 hypothetical protein PV05_07167 [Exophiala xenobiotica]